MRILFTGAMLLSMAVQVDAREDKSDVGTSNDIVALLYQRHCIIEGLQETIELLRVAQYDLNQVQLFIRGLYFLALNDYSFCHPKVKACIEEIIQSRSLTPLLLLWDACAEYRFLDDEYLTKELITAVFLIMRGVAIAKQVVCARHSFDLEDIALVHDSDCLIGMVNLVRMHLQGICTELSFEEMMSKQYRSHIAAEKPQAEVIVRQFYFSRALACHADLLERLYDSGLLSELASYTRKIKQLHLESLLACRSPLLNEVTSLLLSAHIDPLLARFAELEQYKYCLNVRYVRDLAMVLLELYVRILRFVLVLNQEACPEMQKIAIAHQSVNSISTEAILSAIDMAAELIELALACQTKKNDLIMASRVHTAFFTTLAFLTLANGLRVV